MLTGSWQGEEVSDAEALFNKLAGDFEKGMGFKYGSRASVVAYATLRHIITPQAAKVLYHYLATTPEVKAQ